VLVDPFQKFEIGEKEEGEEGKKRKKRRKKGEKRKKKRGNSKANRAKISGTHIERIKVQVSLWSVSFGKRTGDAEIGWRPAPEKNIETMPCWGIK